MMADRRRLSDDIMKADRLVGAYFTVPDAMMQYGWSEMPGKTWVNHGFTGACAQMPVGDGYRCMVGCRIEVLDDTDKPVDIAGLPDDVADRVQHAVSDILDVAGAIDLSFAMERELGTDSG